MIVILLCLNLITKDILRPSIGVCAVFTASIVCAFSNSVIWKYSMSVLCATVIFCGVLLYTITDLIVSNRRRVVNDTNDLKINRINISTLFYVISIFFMSVSSILYYRDIIYIASKYGALGAWSTMIRFYRNGTMTGDLDIGISSLASNSYIISTALAYIYLYVFIHNLILNKKDKINFIYLVPVVIFLINTLFTGGRMPMLRLIIGGIFLFYFLSYKINGRKSFNSKNFLKLVFIMILTLYGFATISTLVGRNYDGNPIYYITSYMGGSVPLLDLFLQDPVHHNIWGYETFPSILSFLGRRFDIDAFKSILVNKEFRSMNFYSIGNVYTAFRAYISDFGFLGMGILTIIHSTFYSYFYNKINRKIIRFGRIDLSLLVYMYFVHAIYLFSIDDRFYMDLCSINTIKMIIIFAVLCKFLTCRIDIQHGKIRICE